MQKGKLYLIPNTLGGESLGEIIPVDVMQLCSHLRVFAVEDIKTARRLLRKMDRDFPINDCEFYPLHKNSKPEELHPIVSHLYKGENVGVMSDAGCPGIADPGASLVSLCQKNDIIVHPFVGPSSILLALMGSGFSGQTFSFYGYLPKERKDRVKKLKDFEADARRNGTTHIFMDTPYRNMNVLEDLLNELADHTMLCIASNITFPDQSIRSMQVKDWRDHAYDLNKIPTIFIIGIAQF